MSFPATGNRRWRIDSILASYSAAPTGGRLTVISDEGVRPDGSNPAAVTVLDLDLTASGLTSVPMPDDGLLAPSANAVLTITLNAAGGSIVGKLAVTAHPE